MSVDRERRSGPRGADIASPWDASNQAAVDAGLPSNFYGDYGTVSRGENDINTFMPNSKVYYNGKLYDVPESGNPNWTVKTFSDRGIPYIIGPGGKILVESSNPQYQAFQQELIKANEAGNQFSTFAPLLAAAGMFAGPVATNMGLYGAAAGAGAGAGAGVEAGISPETLTQLQLSSGADTALAWTGADAGAGAGALGSLADASGLGYGPTGAMTAEQWLASPGAAPGASTAPPASPTTPGAPTVTPQAVTSMLQAGMALPDILKAIQSGVGIASGLNTVFNPTTAVDPNMINALWQAGRDTYNRSLVPNADLKAKADAAFAAGQNTYNTALDPQGALYARTLQQIQDQARASSSAHGVAMSPFAAGTENKATSDFNIDWNNKQLDRQIAGANALTGSVQPSVNYGAQDIQRQNAGMTGFANAGNVAANAGIANNAQAFMQNQVGTNALTTGIGSLGDWLKNIWGAGSTPNPVAGSTPTGGFNMDYFSKPVQQPGMYYAS